MQGTGRSRQAHVKSLWMQRAEEAELIHYSGIIAICSWLLRICTYPKCNYVLKHGFSRFKPLRSVLKKMCQPTALFAPKAGSLLVKTIPEKQAGDHETEDWDFI